VREGHRVVVGSLANITRMQSSARIGFWFGLGVTLLLMALFFQTVTLAGQRYTSVLITAFVLTIVADLCFIQTFRRGGAVIRFFSVLLLLPTVFVVADFIRRAPYLFR
jgi:hypothetical protein